MEEALLPKKEEKKWVFTWGSLVEELKKVSYMAAPMVAVMVSQYLLQVVSLMMAGHLGELSLSGVAIATSFTNVTGFSLLKKNKPVTTLKSAGGSTAPEIPLESLKSAIVDWVLGPKRGPFGKTIDFSAAGPSDIYIGELKSLTF